MSELKRQFGIRLKELRTKAGIKQEQLAKKIDIAVRNLSKIETGITFPSSETLEKIINALDIPPKELFDFEHQEKHENAICENSFNEKTFSNNLFGEIVFDLENNKEKIPVVYKVVKAMID